MWWRKDAKAVGRTKKNANMEVREVKAVYCFPRQTPTLHRVCV
jgi:hypothetical protein